MRTLIGVERVVAKRGNGRPLGPSAAGAGSAAKLPNTASKLARTARRRGRRIDKKLACPNMALQNEAIFSITRA
jgi:hypothetical protein